MDIPLDQLETARRKLQREQFILVRNGRDVIKAGTVRRWDNGPLDSCPIQDMFYRRVGMRATLRENGSGLYLQPSD